MIGHGEVDFSKKSMRTLLPVKPEQHNYSDCGIYLLHYIEKIFSSVAQFYWPEAVNTLNENWFPLDEVTSEYFFKTSSFQMFCNKVAFKRSNLAHLIRTLNEQQRLPGEPQVLVPES